MDDGVKGGLRKKECGCEVGRCGSQAALRAAAYAKELLPGASLEQIIEQLVGSSRGAFPASPSDFPARRGAAAPPCASVDPPVLVQERRRFTAHQHPSDHKLPRNTHPGGFKAKIHRFVQYLNLFGVAIGHGGLDPNIEITSEKLSLEMDPEERVLKSQSPFKERVVFFYG
ncbi:hypothetical protein L3X38_023120 [Prunus dulcis]|uniref:Uncharacterized protein n=1 Tax=Prunus dulcis TaxID=3755 RepID=A0AAD4Z511_PRUDU|nr:hypothetical protein L3X38_023120 [Prunus dulcis]